MEVSWKYTWLERCVRGHTVAELAITKYLDELAHWIVKESTLWTLSEMSDTKLSKGRDWRKLGFAL